MVTVPVAVVQVGCVIANAGAAGVTFTVTTVGGGNIALHPKGV